VLVADDYEPWRRRVASALQESPRWHVLGEVSDGLEAVREAQACKPDVVMLDIGLPALNGLEAARRIRANDPNSRILFLTAQTSPDVAVEALETGARGYLMKGEAGDSILLALETVVAGGRFVSPGLPSEVGEAAWYRDVAAAPRHDAFFPRDERSLIHGYARFAEAALAAGHALVVPADHGRLEQLRQELSARGVEVEAAIANRRYYAVDTDAYLTAIANDGFDDVELSRWATALVETAEKAAPGRVSVCGEIAPQLWRAGRGDLAVRIERGWSDVVRRTGADTLCGYLIDTRTVAERNYSVFRDLCAEHGDVRVR
jgi:DNA-binding NarL/FixJ family response regulator